MTRPPGRLWTRREYRDGPSGCRVRPWHYAMTCTFCPAKTQVLVHQKMRSHLDKTLVSSENPVRLWVAGGGGGRGQGEAPCAFRSPGVVCPYDRLEQFRTGYGRQ